MNPRLLPAPRAYGDLAEDELAEGRSGAEIKFGLAIIGVFVLVLLVWGAFVPLDAAAYAQGQLAVAGHRETLQNKEGGVVRAVDVREGDHVRSGQVLIELAGADVQAAESSLSAQVLGLEAERARLQAEQLSQSTIQWPAELTDLAGADRDAAQRAMQIQMDQFRSSAVALQAHKSVLRSRVSELRDQVLGYQREAEAIQHQQSLMAEELKSMKSLADQGYAPMSQVRSLERSQADLEGRVGQYTASIGQSQEQMEETRLQALQLDTDAQEQAAKAQRDVEFQLDDLSPKLRAARDQLARTQVRAPSDGRVVGLTVFTAGAVIAPGQRLMDVVPDQAALVVEAQVSAADADALHVGQTTEVRLGGGRDRTLPILKGVLTAFSADSLVNEKSGAPYFAAEVTIPASQLAIIKAVKGDAALRPGLPAQIIIPTAKRTALQYLFEPLSRTLWRSFRER